MFDVNQPANSITWRGGAGGRRGRRGQGVDNRRGQAGGNRLADRPVRCPNEAPPGTFCGYPNFPEAAKCGRCGIRNPYFKPLEQNNPPTIASAATRGAETEAEVRVIGPGMGENSKRRVAFLTFDKHPRISGKGQVM